MLGNIGPMEIAIVLLVVLLIFGPKRLPGLAGSVGRGIREFRETISGDQGAAEDQAKIAERAPAPGSGGQRS